MTNSARCIAIAAALISTTVSAQQSAGEVTATAVAAPLKAGALLQSSDGKRLGLIERVQTAKDGTPVTASLILDSRFVYVPAATISASGSGFVTSLTKAEVRRLK